MLNVAPAIYVALDAPSSLAHRMGDFRTLHNGWWGSPRIYVVWHMQTCFISSSSTPRFWLFSKTVLLLRSANGISRIGQCDRPDPIRRVYMPTPLESGAPSRPHPHAEYVKANQSPTQKHFLDSGYKSTPIFLPAGLLCRGSRRHRHVLKCFSVTN
jgi:hypothetical protein